MKNGVLEYYANKLEREGIVKIDRMPGQTRFYPPGTPPEEAALIRNLRQETPKQILASLLQHGSMSFSGLVREVKKSPATVSNSLSQLTSDGIVGNSIVDFKRVYHVENVEKLRDIVDKYHPNLIESSADRLADTFSLL